MEQENKPKKSIWSKLSSAVFEETTEQVDDSTTVSTPTSGAPSKFNYSDVSVNGNANPNMPAMVNPNANGMFDEKFYNSFKALIEANNIEGVDYFEFSKAKSALDNTGMADPLKYQAAFSSLKANSNLTKQTLLETADFYIEKLKKEEKEFGAEMQNEIVSQVNSRLAQAKYKQDEIAKKQEQINSLQAEMGTLQSEIGNLNMEAQQTQVKIDATAKNFKVSLEVLIGQINLDKQNITTYIQ